MSGELAKQKRRLKKKSIFTNRRWSLFCLVVKKPLVASQHRQFLPVPPAQGHNPTYALRAVEGQ
jgi:hypothetical protein